MEATEIITIEQAREWLSSEESDKVLDRLIRGALSWVEEYTGHTLASKDKTIQIPYSGYPISDYPMLVTSVKDLQGVNVPYTFKNGIFDVYFFAAPGALVNITVGYQNLYDIPPILIEAAYKMLTYLHENRDIYTFSTMAAPLDVKLMINKLRRNLI